MVISQNMKYWLCPRISTSGFSVGADMAVPRAALKKAGYLPFVETQDDGAVEASADIVAAAIRAHARSDCRLIILSASSLVLKWRWR